MKKHLLKNRGFTLIELLISIGLVTVITGSIYFCIQSALESWTFSRDELGLQKVLSETMDSVLSGTPSRYGLKDSLEILSADSDEMTFVVPWTDEGHTVGRLESIYTLNRRIKPGAPIPIAQILLPESDHWQIVPTALVDLEDSKASQVKLALAAPLGARLRFIYHPDAIDNPDVVKRIYWQASTGEVFFQDESQRNPERLSQNALGVRITKMKLRYFSNANQPVTEDRSVEKASLPVITGVELFLEATLNGKTQSLSSFVAMRNAPMRKGYLYLTKGLSVRIPDSETIRALSLTNFSGIANNDQIQLEAIPSSGPTWRLTAQFEKIGSGKPMIKLVTVEYPPNHVVFSERPNAKAELGLNLNLLDPNGFYDYDDDSDVEDAVKLEGEVTLVVREMSLQGAGIFVRP